MSDPANASPYCAARLLPLLVALSTLPLVASCGGSEMTEPDSPCRVGQELGPGEVCAVGRSDTFEVMDDGVACLIQRRPDGENRRCSNREVMVGSFSARRIDEATMWRIDALP